MHTSIQEAFDFGYQTGLNWNHNWIPGGPWFYHATHADSKKDQDKAKFLQDCNKAWLDGWHKAQSEIK